MNTPESDIEKNPSSLGEDVSEKPSTVIFPEGGLKAWSVVVGCFCIMFITFGYLNAFGYDIKLAMSDGGKHTNRPIFRVYEAFYIRQILPDKSPSAIAWIGSLQVFFQFSAGLISGPITDRWGPRVSISSFRRYSNLMFWLQMRVDTNPLLNIFVFFRSFSFRQQSSMSLQ